MSTNEIRNGGLGALPINIETEIAAQLVELNEGFHQYQGDYGRRLNNLLSTYAQEWDTTEAPARMVLYQIAGIIGWKDYPGGG